MYLFVFSSSILLWNCFLQLVSFHKSLIQLHTHCAKKAIIHQVTTMLATWKCWCLGDKVSGHQYQWSAGGYNLDRTFLEVSSMVVSWWIMFFLHSDSIWFKHTLLVSASSWTVLQVSKACCPFPSALMQRDKCLKLTRIQGAYQVFLGRTKGSRSSLHS